MTNNRPSLTQSTLGGSLGPPRSLSLPSVAIRSAASAGMMTRIDDDLEGALRASQNRRSEKIKIFNFRFLKTIQVEVDHTRDVPVAGFPSKIKVYLCFRTSLPDRCAQFIRLLHSFKVRCTVCVTFWSPIRILFWRPDHI